MTERPRELDQRFQMGGSIWGYYIDDWEVTFRAIATRRNLCLRIIMVNKAFLLLDLTTEYRSRRRRRWCANNIAADHQMFISLTGQLSWQRLRRSAVDLYSKAKKSLFESLFRAVRGNVRTPSMARWKARGRLCIRHNWTFFAISYGWDVMSGNRSKSAFFEGGGSLWTQISKGRGRRRPTTLGIRVTEWLPFRVV